MVQGGRLTASQGILEDLLKAQKLETILHTTHPPWSAHWEPTTPRTENKTSKVRKQNVHGQVDGGMEPETALVGAQRRVELHAVAAVDAQLALVVLPGDAELQDSLGDGADGQSGAVLGVFLEEAAVLEGAGQLCAARRFVSFFFFFFFFPKCSSLYVMGFVDKKEREKTDPCRPARIQARKGGETWRRFVWLVMVLMVLVVVVVVEVGVVACLTASK